MINLRDAELGDVIIWIEDVKSAYLQMEQETEDPAAKHTCIAAKIVLEALSKSLLAKDHRSKKVVS